MIVELLKEERNRRYQDSLLMRRCGGESSSLDMLTNSFLRGIMVSLIFLEGLDEEALEEFMVEWCKEDEDDDRNEEDDLYN
uniref:Uncharacterized protein n=1 Tax=Tanacetum cinerariifolium TaxID=118510 RepID=A0A6L2M900_TANCI|nr:hypothetical protein [Tanacetum cinerariifolium]